LEKKIGAVPWRIAEELTGAPLTHVSGEHMSQDHCIIRSING
jgi:hypothetical protein